MPARTTDCATRQLQRTQFGRRSEKLDPDQFNLALEDLEQAVAASEAEQEKADPALRQARTEKRRAGRGALPEHLPRVEIVIDPEDPPARAAAARSGYARMGLVLPPGFRSSQTGSLAGF